MKHWNEFYDLVLNVKKCYIANNGDTAKPFKQWLEYLNNDIFNILFQPVEINQEGNLVLFRYGLDAMKPGFWNENNLIYRDCRSIVVDLENDELVLSPFKKFFNIGELEETSIDNIYQKISKAKTVEFSDKLDGSMQSYRFYNGEIIGAGSRSLNKANSFRLEAGYNYLTNSHKLMLKQHPTYTFIFELIDPKDVHVVDYSKKTQGLYLIGIIDMKNGKETSYNDVIQLAKHYNINSTKIEQLDLNTVLDLSTKLHSNEKEGWVVGIDGYKVKIKCDDYVALHKVINHISSTNVIIKAVADNTIDDLICKLPLNHKKRIELMIEKCINYIQLVEQEVNTAFNDLNVQHNNKKDFMIGTKTIKPYIRSYVILKYLNQDYNILTSKSGKVKKWNEIIDYLYKEQ